MRSAGSSPACGPGAPTPRCWTHVRVDYYGTPTPLNQVASISVPDARTLVIQPWDADRLTKIEKAIQKSDLGLTPANDGKVIRLTMPAADRGAPQAAGEDGGQAGRGSARGDPQRPPRGQREAQGARQGQEGLRGRGAAERTSRSRRPPTGSSPRSTSSRRRRSRRSWSFDRRLDRSGRRRRGGRRGCPARGHPPAAPAAARGRDHGRERAVGRTPRPSARGGAPGGRPGGSRDGPHGGPPRHRIPHALRVLLRELDPAAGRGLELSDAAARELRWTRSCRSSWRATSGFASSAELACPRPGRAAERRARRPRDRGQHRADAPDGVQLRRPPTSWCGALRALARDVARGGSPPRRSTRRRVTAALYTAGVPDPDLLIRTSGEYAAVELPALAGRVHGASGPPTLWPDFCPRDLYVAVAEFQRRSRRFGGLCKRRPAAASRSPCSRSGS